MKMIYEQYFIYYFMNIFIYETCWTLTLLENQSHTSKQVVFQIWGWYLKKWAFSKILFGRSTKFSPLDSSKTPLVHTVVGFVICTRVSLSQFLQEHTRTHTQFFLWHIQTTHLYQHTHTIIAALFSNWLYNMQKQKTGIKQVFTL